MDPIVKTLIIVAVVCLVLIAGLVYLGHQSGKRNRQSIRHHYDPLGMDDETVDIDARKFRRKVRRQAPAPPGSRIEQLIEASSLGTPEAKQPREETGAIAYRDSQRARTACVRGNSPTYGDLFDAGELREEPRRHRRISS